MDLKLIKLTRAYEKQLGEMIDEWKADQEINHTNRSPWAIFKNDYHDFDYYLEHLELKTATEGKSPASSELSPETLNLFEDVAYTMAKHADENVPDTVEKWLDQFDVFSIYFILPQIVELWRLNEKTTVTPKKKADKPPDR